MSHPPAPNESSSDADLAKKLIIAEVIGTPIVWIICDAVGVSTPLLIFIFALSILAIAVVAAFVPRMLRTKGEK